MADVITVSIPDEPGALAKLTTVLAEGGVQVDGVNLVPKGGSGQAMFLVRDPDKCLDVLKNVGFPGTRREAALLTLSNDRGALADVCQRLSKAGINIEGCFGTTYGRAGQLVLLTNDDRAVHEILDQL